METPLFMPINGLESAGFIEMVLVVSLERAAVLEFLVEPDPLLWKKLDHSQL
jgi:hypothetical protein